MPSTPLPHWSQAKLVEKELVVVDTGSRRAKAPKDQHTRVASITNEEKRRSDRRWTKSSDIHQRSTSTHPPTMLDASPEWRLDGEDFINFIFRKSKWPHLPK
jgi:hypothetical protein